MNARDTFCSFCGTPYASTDRYPRTCAKCGVQVWANPIPVSVVLLPVVDGARTGLLVIRRGIEVVGIARHRPEEPPEEPPALRVGSIALTVWP